VAAFTLVLNADGATGTLLEPTTAIGSETPVPPINFGGAVEFESLPDGRYTLTALPGKVSVGGQSLDCHGGGTPGDNYTFGEGSSLYRMFSDINGDRQVDIADLTPFAGTFGLTSGQANFLAAFDHNGDGQINIVRAGPGCEASGVPQEQMRASQRRNQMHERVRTSRGIGRFLRSTQSPATPRLQEREWTSALGYCEFGRQ
jgi:hypothetical protein